MNLKRPNKSLQNQIQLAVKDMLCPVHSKFATITMESEDEEVTVEACCVFFKRDIMIVGERIRKDFIYKTQKTNERLERERRRRDAGF